MKNRKLITKEKMNQQGILNIVLGIICWVLLMFKLKVF